MVRGDRRHTCAGQEHDDFVIAMTEITDESDAAESTIVLKRLQ